MNKAIIGKKIINFEHKYYDNVDHVYIITLNDESYIKIEFEDHEGSVEHHQKKGGTQN